MNPGDASWWWQYGLDGIVGGVVGGLVTGLAVVLTIRHERRLTREADVRRIVGEAHLAVVRLEMGIERGTVTERDVPAVLDDLLLQAWTIRSLADWPLSGSMSKWVGAFESLADEAGGADDVDDEKAQGDVNTGDDPGVRWELQALARDFREETGAWLAGGPREHRRVLRDNPFGADQDLL